MKQYRKTACTAGQMMLRMLMVCTCVATSETAEDLCEAEHGDACKTVASSMMQTHAVRQKTLDDVKETDESQEIVENDLEQSVEAKVILHNGFKIQTFPNGITCNDGRKKWILFSTDPACDDQRLDRIVKCMPPKMKLKDRGHPSQGGSCYLVMCGHEAELTQDLDNCADILSPSLTDIEQDTDIKLPDDEQGNTPSLMEESRSIPWGLDRIDEVNLPLDGNYQPPGSGRDVNVFVADTGIRITHQDFGGRAIAGYDHTSGSAITCTPTMSTCSIDGHGHGTHCAGTIGGSKYGVAKDAKVIAVKVLSDKGSGATTWILGGIDFAERQHKASTNPSIISMSLGSNRVSSAHKDAVNSAVAAGVMVVVAAGNSGSDWDACRSSPAHVPSAITVGSTAADDSRSGFSSVGPCLDLFAPGSHILSTWKNSDTDTKSISGTSMACPHVSGAAALIYSELFSRNGQTIPTVSDVETKLLTTALSGKVTNADGNLAGSPNLLLNVEFSFGPTPPPTPSPPTPAPTPAPPLAPSDCSFESGNCFWLQDTSDDFDWSPGSGRTPSGGTGPSQASDGSKYLFIETSAPRAPGDEAILTSPAMALATNQKIVFDYNMDGADIGSLNFLVDGQSMWGDGSDHGNVWKTAEVDLSAYTGNDVILGFQGLRGKSWQGDIAIDNVRFVPVSTVPVPMPMPPPSVPAPMPMPPPSVPVPMPMPPPTVPVPMPMPPPTVPVVVPGPPGPPGPAGPPGPLTVGPPGPPGPPR
jgi:hypothetical protein